MGKQIITVESDDDSSEHLDLIAESIIKVSDAFQKIEDSPLKRQTIVLLLQDATGLSKGAINKILDAAPKLREYYLKEVLT